MISIIICVAFLFVHRSRGINGVVVWLLSLVETGREAEEEIQLTSEHVSPPNFTSYGIFTRRALRSWRQWRVLQLSEQLILLHNEFRVFAIPNMLSTTLDDIITLQSKLYFL